MASFDKVPPASTPTLAPKPIATAAPSPLPSAFTRERFFSDGDGDGDGDNDEEEEDDDGVDPLRNENNRCGFSRQEGSYWDVLRSYLTDPVTKHVTSALSLFQKILFGQTSGNKRTPLRFVGRVAVVTAQCLNGWYVVKTLDNGESVKLQLGSLAKLSTDQPTSAGPTRANYPNWL